MPKNYVERSEADTVDVGGTINSFNMIISDPQQKKFFYDSRVEVT